MTKRLVDIDDDLLEAAKRAQGSTTIKETVNTALANSARNARQPRVSAGGIHRFAGACRDLGDDEVMAQAWR